MLYWNYFSTVETMSTRNESNVIDLSNHEKGKSEELGFKRLIWINVLPSPPLLNQGKV